MKRSIFILVLFMAFSCGKQENEANKELKEKQVVQPEKIEVITVNYPLYFFAQRIGGDLVDLKYIIPPDIDPAFWSPDSEALSSYQAADLIILNGADYEKWIEDVSLPGSKILNTTEAYQEDLIQIKVGVSHSHGNEGEHQHTGYATTTWLDFKMALKQAEMIKNRLIQMIPEQNQLLNQNFEALKKDLESLDSGMTSVASTLKGLNLLGSHPVYQYLSRAYKLHLHSVHFEPNKIPEGHEWEEIFPLMSKSKTNLMLWENTPLDNTKMKLQEYGIKSIVFNPCGNMPSNGDFLSVMKDNISALKMME